jgi:hypothetical protein
MIGRIAGLNSFEHPMAGVGEGLLQFLRVGLWEITAYVIVAGVALTKARWIADRFGAATWRERRTWADLDWPRSELWLLDLAAALILGSGLVEALWITRREAPDAPGHRRVTVTVRAPRSSGVATIGWRPA